MNTGSSHGQVGVRRLCGAVMLAGTLSGCAGWRVEAGLANARVSDIDPIRYAETFAHPAITNGDASCPPSGRPEDDRLFHRWPACNAPSPWAVRVPRAP